MTDKPDGKRWGWTTWAWIVVALLVFYPVSMVPAALCCGWLEHFGIIGPPPNRVMQTMQTIYAPLSWLMDNSPEAGKAADTIGKTLGPIAPKP
jgi:hypothetical protein